MKNNKLALVYALSAILLWSTIAVAFKIGLKTLEPIQLLFNSVVISTFVFFVIVVFQKKWFLIRQSKRRDYVSSALLGFLNPFLYYAVLLEAYDILPAQIAQPLNYTWPIVLVLLSIPLLKQKISIFSILAIIISFSGVVVISLQGETSFSIKNPLGVLLATGSSVIWALFWLLGVKDRRDEVVKLFMSFAFSLVYLSIYLFSVSSVIIDTSEGLLASVYIGFFEMGFTFLLWMLAMKLTSTTDKIGNLVFISPFLSLFWISFILKESIYESTIIGLILLIAGIILNRVYSR